MEPEKKEIGKQSINDREEAVLRFWKENRIFEKSLKQTEGKEPYVFYDGPPFATGLPHHGHLLQGTIKDIIPRYQTMRGRYVRRQWGWDCHGLPIENIIEKELGFKQKKDIEAYGVEKFNQKARESVLTYEREWKEIVPRMGRWVDMEHAYRTMGSSYTESIWWAFKTLYDKKLIYAGYKSMHICPRCETTLAASEVAQGYKEVKDISVYVKFELVDEPGTFLVAWTTTPWTLPGNVALAINPSIKYQVLSIKYTDGKTEKYICATERLSEVFKGKEISVEGEMLGKELVGKSYTPVFDDYAKDEQLANRENGWKVYAADFVTTESGTGIVHIAPAFGEDDMELGKKMKLPFVQHVAMNGTIKPEVKTLADMHVKPLSDDDKIRLATDIAILKYLQEHGNFFAKENITHAYPHCWRCDWPLLNYAASSWFVNVTTLRERLVEENKEINWVPENIREGRFGKWLEGARDWAISRSRYWGAPLPVWKCNKCANVEAVGNLEELRAKTASQNAYFVMRHGEAETNVKGIVSYKHDDLYALTERGRAQVKAAAVKLKEKKIDIIIASPILRTKESAEIAAGALGVAADAVMYDPRLCEVNSGEFNGKPIEAYRAYFTSTLEKFTKPSPGGETLEAMKSRLAEFLYEMDTKYRSKRILIVTHEYDAWLLQAASRGATNEEASGMRIEGKEDYIGNGEVQTLAFAPIPHNVKYELDFHRPYIDQTTYQCSCGLGTMERIPDVFDCWFESGSMPFAQFHYLGDETTPEGKLFTKNFPADFIAEAVDQTRGWFYTMLVLSVALFDRAPYKSVITTGLILAEDGQKMSKKLKNYPDPLELATKFGADAVRLYMVNSPVVRGEELLFSLSGVDEVFKKVTLRLDNVRSFYELYAKDALIKRAPPPSSHVLDRFIIARWQETHAEVTHYLDTHELDRATRLLLPLIEDLSTWYLRRSRVRFKDEESEDYVAAVQTTGWILFGVARLIAPFMPFLAEDIYQRLSVENKKESVHLEEWPPMGIAGASVTEDMEEVRRIVSLALLARAKAGIKVRQPLSLLSVNHEPKWLAEHHEEYDAIIKDEVNVKEVRWNKEGEEEITLDTTLTAELEEEGQLREVIRLVQDTRKKNGLVPDDTVHVLVVAPARAIASIHTHEDQLKKAVNARSVELKEGELNVEVKKVN